MPLYPIRRRPRECKTCLQCRASKVRCDRNVPCSNCVKRGFNCAYGRPPPPPPPPAAAAAAVVVPRPPLAFNPSIASAATLNAPQLQFPSTRATSNQDTLYDADAAQDNPSSDTVSVSPIEWDEINTKLHDMEQIIASLQSLFQAHSGPSRKPTEPVSDVYSGADGRSPHAQGTYASTALKACPVHIGSRSAFIDILDKSKSSADTAQVLPKDDLITELAMGNEAASYPFVDLWASDPHTFNIGGVCDVLPDDNQCLKFFNFYKDIGSVIYPVLSNIGQLEHNIKRLLEGRRQAGGVYGLDPNGLVRPFGMRIERELTSWVYVSCSYQCLRMLNYVSQPTVEIIQILLIISGVLSYNMNAGASYTLLGMTERMCMVLGLHVETPGFAPAIQEVRRRVWWAMAFQNSHFSLAYDRPSITMISQPEIPYHPKSMPGHRSYFETLCRIISVVLEVHRVLMASHHSHLRPHEIREHVERIERILAETAPHLRYRENCMTLAENIERAELRLHSSYYISFLCRVSLDPDVPLDDRKRAHIRHDCIRNLIITVEAFIELHKISPYASRTWISVQRTIASAFLLIANSNDQLWRQTWDLVERLEMVLANHVYSDGSTDLSNRTESARHLASSLQALREVSAAFRASNGQKPAPKQEGTTPSISPGTMLPSFDIANRVTTTSIPPLAEAYGIPLDDGHIDTILNQVSDVMLFPSMNIKNA